MALFSILVDIAAKTADFESSMRRVESQLESLGDTARKALEFAGLSIGLKELISSFDEFISRAGELEHTSEKIGIAVEDLSRLQFAAGQVGVASAELTTGIERFAKVADQAAAGGKQQAAAFDAIGVSVKNTTGQIKPMNDLLLEVANKFAGYKDSAEKTALAQVLFGRAGADLIPILNQGSQGIADFEKRSDDLGNTINESTSKAADGLTSKIGELKAAGQGFWNLAAQQLLPTLTALTGELIGGAQSTNKFTDEVAPFVTGLKLITDVGYSVYKTLSDVGAALGALSAIAVSVAKGNFSEAKDIWKSYQDDAEKSEKDANAFLAKLWDDSTKGSSAWSANLVSDWNAIANAAKTSAPIVSTATNDMAAQMDAAWRKLSVDADKTFDENQKRIASYGDSAGKSLEKLPAYGKTSWDQIDEISQTGAKSVQSAFSDFLFDPATKGFGGLATDFGNALRRMAADAAATNLFKALFGSDKEGNSGLGGIIGNLLNGYGFGSGGVTSADLAGDYQGVGDALSSLDYGGGLASGGPVQSGKWYTAGEHGPEPIWGGGAGAFATGYGGGGSPVNINHSINFNGADSSLRASLPSFAAQIRAGVLSDVLNAWSRSGLKHPQKI